MRPDRWIAMIAYCTPLGWVIAFFLHQQNPSRLSGFHLRQSLGLMLSLVGISFIQFLVLGVPVIGVLTAPLAGLLNLLVFAAIIYSIVQAVSGKTTYLPILGNFFDIKFQTFIQP